MSDTAEILPLPGIAWSGPAALEDARQQVVPGDDVMVIWLDKEGDYHYRSSVTVERFVWMCHLGIKHMVHGDG